MNTDPLEILVHHRPPGHHCWDVLLLIGLEGDPRILRLALKPLRVEIVSSPLTPAEIANSPLTLAEIANSPLTPAEIVSSRLTPAATRHKRHLAQVGQILGGDAMLEVMFDTIETRAPSVLWLVLSMSSCMP
jgi:hypothetical protein